MNISHYTYDGNGNRLTRTTPAGSEAGSYDAQDRLVTYNAASDTYTAAGELSTRTDSNGTTTFTYDELGNLTHVTLANGTAIDYVIDGENRRIGKKIDGTLVQQFVYSGSLSPSAEVDANGDVVARFIYGTRPNVPDLIIKGDTEYRVITDHLGSPRLIVKVDDGNVAQRMDFDEFGKVLADNNPGFQPFGFAGCLFDRDTMLVRFGARDYDPRAGRWTAKDPFGFSGGDANLYGYVVNDPINSIDPSGNEPIPDCVKHIFKTKKYRKFFPSADLDAVDLDTNDQGVKNFTHEEAITPGGNTILFNPDYYNYTTLKGIALIGHELVHVDQWTRDPNGCDDYLLWELTHPGSNPQDNPYEREAYTKEQALLKQLQRDFGKQSSCGCH